MQTCDVLYAAFIRFAIRCSIVRLQPVAAMICAHVCFARSMDAMASLRAVSSGRPS